MNRSAACFCVPGATSALCSAIGVTEARFIAVKLAPSRHALKPSVSLARGISPATPGESTMPSERDDGVCGGRIDVRRANGRRPWTHQGSPQAPTEAPVLQSSLLPNVECLPAVDVAQTPWICPGCAAAMSVWARQGFVDRRRSRTRLRQARATPSSAETSVSPSPVNLAIPLPRQRLEADLHLRQQVPGLGSFFGRPGLRRSFTGRLSRYARIDAVGEGIGLSGFPRWTFNAR